MGVRRGEGAALRERSLKTETEPEIGEGDQREAPRMGRGFRRGGKPRVGEGTHTGRGLGNVKGIRIWGQGCLGNSETTPRWGRGRAGGGS